MLEVGPGLGSLTLPLLDRGARVTAVEIDPVLAKQLPATIADHSHSEINRLTVINQDILTLMPSDLTEQPTALVANLPYNVAVPALLHLMAEFPSIRTVMVMVQAEVAERLAAEPGGKDYGVPSAKVRFYGNVRRHGMVSPIGEALARLPASVPRLRIWREPMRRTSAPKSAKCASRCGSAWV